jgi:transcriptional regulator with XRE-family HTH domain
MDGARQTVARNLRDLMDKSPDLRSASALARRSGVHQTTISLILREKQGTSIDHLEKLAHALGVQTWVLLHPTPQIAGREAELYSKLRSLLAGEK